MENKTEVVESSNQITGQFRLDLPGLEPLELDLGSLDIPSLELGN